MKICVQIIMAKPAVVQLEINSPPRDGKRVGRNGFYKNQTQTRFYIVNPNPNRTRKNPNYVNPNPNPSGFIRVRVNPKPEIHICLAKMK